MTDRQPFLSAILAQPDDDGPRLVYCDWLEEQGESDRAEFIRLQIKMAACRMCHRKDGTKRKDGYARNCGRCLPGAQRAQRLMGCDSFPAWCPQVIADNVNTSRYRRGFIEEIHCPWQSWLTHHAAIRSATPLREVRLTTRPMVISGGGRNRGHSRLDGCEKWYDNATAPAVPVQDLANWILTAQWPGIKFELPSPSQMAEDLTGWVPMAIPGATADDSES